MVSVSKARAGTTRRVSMMLVQLGEGKAYLCVTQVTLLQVCQACACLLLWKPFAQQIEEQLSEISSKPSASFLASDVVSVEYALGLSSEVHAGMCGQLTEYCDA